MEDYIETFLYILFTIIFIIVGTLGKKKRKPQQTTNKFVSNKVTDEYTEQRRKQPLNIFDYIENQFQEQENEFEFDDQEPPAREEPKIEEEQVEMVENVERQIKDIPVFTNKKEEKVEKIDFELKKAIIYSEILNRKYY